MAFNTIRQFQADGATYNCLYDFDADLFDVERSDGLDPENIVSEEELGVPEGTVVRTTCHNFNKYTFKASLGYPFLAREIEYNVAECGYIPTAGGGNTCDLAITSAVATDETYIGSYDGTIAVLATTSHDRLPGRRLPGFGITLPGMYFPIQYSLDNHTWQLQNTFTGLDKGTYIVYTRDAANCRAQTTVQVGRVNESQIPTSSLTFPWKEKICYFFRLRVGVDLIDVREPVKWDSVSITAERDRDWHGWNAQYSDGNMQLEFGCPQGMEIIEDEYQAHGSDAEVDLIYGFTYQGNDFLLFEGKLDFNTRKWRPGMVSVSVVRKSSSELLQTRFDTSVSMRATETLDGSPLTHPSNFDIQLHSKQFIKNYENTVDTVEQTAPTGFSNTQDFYYLPETSMPQVNEITENFPQSLSVLPDAPEASSLCLWRLAFDSSITNFHIAFNMSIYVQRRTTLGNGAISGAQYTVNTYFKVVRGGVEFMSQKLGTEVTGSWPNLVVGTQSKTMNVSADYTFPSLSLLKDDEIYIYAVYDSEQASQQSKVSASNIDISFEALESASTSTTQAWMLFDVINHGIKAATDKKSYLVSNLLATINNQTVKDGEFSLYAITNGFNIRNFDPNNKPLHISLKKSLESTKAIAAVGFGFENKGAQEVVRVEKVEFFYQPNEILLIDERVEHYDEEVAKELIYNEIETGYNKYKEDGYNTLDEFNTRHEYLTPIKTHKNKLTLKSDFIASGYSIEDTRRQQFATTATNSYENDEEAFIISLRRVSGKYLAEKDEPFATVTGLIAPSTAYNLRISPKRILQNWAKWFTGALAFKAGTELVRNMFVDKNGELETQFLPTEPFPMGDEQLMLHKENANITIDELNNGDRIYRPEWVNVKGRITPDKILLINEAMRGGASSTQNYGYITVKHPDSGQHIAIWPYKLKYNFAKEDYELRGLKCFNNPVTPVGTCCNWLAINGCRVLINGQKVILNQ